MKVINDSKLAEIKQFAFEQHANVNHFYDGKPYSFHLEMVADFALRFKDLIDEDELNLALAGCYCHDLIEDCRLTYNDIGERFGKDLAEITYALTNEKGKNRAERANVKYYSGITKNKIAHFVKICDRLANINHSVNSGSSMINAYREEHDDFMLKMMDARFRKMFNLMSELLN